MTKEKLTTNDAVLLMFLSLVEEDGVETALTLNVNGVIVSGTLIGANAYYKGITEAYHELSDSVLSKIMEKKFTDLEDAYIKQKEEDNKEEVANPEAFLHLKNAKYALNDNTSSSISTSWWRGRISSIDAISINALN
ncbi:gas vesicle accessory protein GvpU [Niallia sp. 03133]|uniref:gas vesicle accessory protein GvpU n=1 Tax=Niallia sp. 03133 TaxID=3458060 RepID=UPI00404481BB